MPHRPKPLPKRKGQMNRWEQMYSDRLEMMKMAGKVQAYGYEAMRFKLADNTTYTPDFFVCTDEEMQCHEIKGQRHAAGMAKFKIAAAMFSMFRWIMLEYSKRDGWKVVMDL